MGSRESGSEEQPRWLTALINGYGWLLRRNLRWKWTTVIVSAALAVVAFWWLGALCGQELFPQVDSGQFTIHVRLPSGTRIEKTEAAMAKIEKVVESVIGKPDPGYARGEEKHPDSNLQLHISNIGVLMDWPAAYTPNTGPMDAFLLVQLKGKAGMPGVFQYVEELRRQLNQKFPEIEFAFDTGGMLTAALNMGEPSPIHLQITGSNLATHQEIARAARAQIAQVPGAVDVRIYQRLDYPTLKIDIDRTKCADQGVTVEDVVKNLVSATNSSVNFMPAFWLDPRNGNHYFMGVQYYEQEITLDSIRYLPITGADSERPVLLENVAEIKQSTGPAVITHRNITRTTDIYANVLPGYDVGSVVAEIEHRLRTAPELASKITSTERGIEYEIIGRKADLAGTVKKVERNSDGKPVAVSIEPAGGGQRLSYRLDDRTKVNGVLAPRKPVVVWTTDDKQRLQRIDVTKSLIENENGLPGYYQDQGYTFAMMGEVRSMREAIRQFTAGLAIAAVLLFLVMVAMFRSFTTPFVVMMTVPLGMVGVAVALWATKTHLNVQSFMGIIMMMGIVVEYSIVLLDFADHRVRDGSAPEDAVYEAALVRFRPILMTSLTTILALLPMAAGFAGSEADQPLALAIVGGVVAATLLPKFVVPCLYALLKRPESAAEVADA
ncbi:MAG: hypothetical protein KatS3mg105_1912 [Gemmatales bacterium]|nr:MAG: hypothetical protein KatS3mg105_1912 [Gemmatales bacterium]